MQPESSNSWVIGTTAFLTVFGALGVFFDPMVAVSLALVVLVLVKS